MTFLADDRRNRGGIFKYTKTQIRLQALRLTDAVTSTSSVCRQKTKGAHYHFRSGVTSAHCGTFDRQQPGYPSREEF